MLAEQHVCVWGGGGYVWVDKDGPSSVCVHVCVCVMCVCVVCVCDVCVGGICVDGQGRPL